MRAIRLNKWETIFPAIGINPHFNQLSDLLPYQTDAVGAHDAGVEEISNSSENPIEGSLERGEAEEREDSYDDNENVDHNEEALDGEGGEDIKGEGERTRTQHSTCE